MGSSFVMRLSAIGNATISCHALVTVSMKGIQCALTARLSEQRKKEASRVRASVQSNMLETDGFGESALGGPENC
jgi:hypothetical protein